MGVYVFPIVRDRLFGINTDLRINPTSIPYTVKVVVLDWPLNIYTYNSCQKEFPQGICKILQS